jgi:Leucine-rich repeat (LRR) protein
MQKTQNVKVSGEISKISNIKLERSVLKDKVTELDISHNWVVDFEGLEEFTSLVKLDISDNDIEQLAKFPRLVHLKILNISSNKISSLKEIKYLCYLPSLRFLTLKNNKITKMFESFF